MTEIQEKTVASVLVAGVRTKGRYRDSGPLFGKLARRLRLNIAGPPMMLCHDTQFRENDADYEVAFPISKPVEIKDAAIHELPGGRCLALIHQGPYEELARSYEIIRQALRERGHEAIAPSREIYLKGPGMIFKGNPKKYRTELQFFIRGPDQ